MDNVQEINNFNNITSSQAFKLLLFKDVDNSI
jgi:hypothetical protein